MKQVVGDADRGDDWADTARTLHQGQDDQGDRPRPEGVTEHGPEGAEAKSAREQLTLIRIFEELRANRLQAIEGFPRSDIRRLFIRWIRLDRHLLCNRRDTFRRLTAPLQPDNDLHS